MIQVFIIKLRNWIIPLKLVRLLVTHDGGKLIRVGKLSVAERLQGREGKPLDRVTLAPGLPSHLVNRANTVMGRLKLCLFLKRKSSGRNSLKQLL